MLPRKNKIRRNAFAALGNGARMHSPHLVLVAYQESASTEPRFAFSVAKKVARKAVARNRMRRQGYSVLRTLLGRIRGPFAGHFMAKKGADKLSFGELEAEILALLTRANALNNKVEEVVKIR